MLEDRVGKVRHIEHRELEPCRPAVFIGILTESEQLGVADGKKKGGWKTHEHDRSSFMFVM